MLTGLMAAGKTTVAGALASRLGVRADDTDRLVEQQAGIRVAAIFATQGEAAFRAMERAVVCDAVSTRRAPVLALGGGAFLDSEIRAAIAASSYTSVYLHAAPGELVRRLSETDLSERPLLAADPRSVIERLYAQRDPVYRLADRVVETAGRGIDAIVEELLEV